MMRQVAIKFDNCPLLLFNEAMINRCRSDLPRPEA